MTWHTSEGDRYLVGAESRLFRVGLAYSLDWLEANGLNRRGTFLHNETKKSCLFLFEFVAEHLLRPTPELAPLNAWTEGAIAVVYESIREALLAEIKDEYPRDNPSCYWRQLVLDAANEVGLSTIDEDSEEPQVPLVATSKEEGDFDLLLECLIDRILWDSDWQFEQHERIPVMFVEDNGENYFHWHRKPLKSTKEVIESLGRLCGFRRGDFEGEVIS